MKKQQRTILSIAGSDSSAGAGIQADIKAIAANGGYAATVITALTAQNTLGVQAIQQVPVNFIQQQLTSVFDDLNIYAVKIGMLHDTETVQCIIENIQQYQPEIIILDPVMVAKGGAKLSDNTVMTFAKTHLFPLATLITPNIPEAEVLAKTKINSLDDMQQAAQYLASSCGINVLLKGGHLLSDTCQDILVTKRLESKWFQSPRIQTQNTHGTGCSLSSAIAANLTKDMSLENAIIYAKAYVSKAIAAAKDTCLGQGQGPIAHHVTVPKSLAPNQRLVYSS